jgi:SHS2 domain-containing protein
VYEFFEHTADLGLRVRAATLEQLFADAAAGLFAMIVANPDEVQRVQTLQFDLAADGLDDPASLEYLLFDWLSELLFVYETQRVLLVEFAVRCDSQGLHATARGEPLDPNRHRLEHEVKAITYHGLKIQRAAEGWLAEVIVDI